MKKKQTSKIIAIIALCVAVVGITLGFAAFSNTLTISSSATVSPNSSDFKMTIYGISSPLDNDMDLWYEETYDSINTSIPKIETPEDDKTIKNANAARIDNSSHTISNLSVEFIKPDRYGADYAMYFFLIKNEGKYTAYIKESDLNIEQNNKICTPTTEVNKDLVINACDRIKLITQIDGEESDVPGTYEILPNEHIFLFVSMYYTGDAIADQDFSVEFPELTLNFSTTK